MTTSKYDVAARARSILDYWYGPMDDKTALNREVEPFKTHFQRWYGKDPQVDAAIRAEYEPDLDRVAGSGARWDQVLEEWRAVPRGLIALTILIDQLPRNMYRNTARMYTHDPIGLLACDAARTQVTEDLPIPYLLFVYCPLMHQENLTLQERMIVDFERIFALAKVRSAHNLGFYQFALDYAKRHVDVVRKYGRFPHRNELLGRASTPEEVDFLKNSDAYF